MKNQNLLVLVICMSVIPLNAQQMNSLDKIDNQQMKSLDEIDRESFQARAAPFDKGCISVNISEKSVKHVNAPNDIILDGVWQLVEGGDENERLSSIWTDTISAIVPGSVHGALWKAGIIPDPYFGRNDSIAEKQSYKTWWYKKEFTIDDRLTAPRLIFYGIVNKCSVWLNGIKLGDHEGMFGGPLFDVS